MKKQTMSEFILQARTRFRQRLRRSKASPLLTASAKQSTGND